ncbi:uncharacterized protein UHO2_05457 [Ustilago hordei]|uniref:uncharacterized protein n=1 Tax=Ustilago hordei TaxID=120017 RepID=UPI001A5CDFCF|nr:uncharacterized protein UHO2_05457 [Ustilago hordei]SYW86832.1 uncharacterized protein UHO2_05457 [Ustilago hordei]
MMEPDTKDRFEELQRLMERSEERMEKLLSMNRTVTNHFVQRLESLEALIGSNSQSEETTNKESFEPNPAPRPHRTGSFLGQNTQSYLNYEKYVTPTRPRYSQPYEGIPRDTKYDVKNMGEPSPGQSKPLSTPFPKFNLRDVEIFLIKAETWFAFNRVYDHKSMIHHMGQRLTEQYNPCNSRIKAYNKLLNMRLTTDTPGAATRHVEWFRDLEGQVNMEDRDLVIDLFRSTLTHGLQEKFERNPPTSIWEWYQEVEDIDRTSYQFGNRPLPPHLLQAQKPREANPQDSNTCHMCRGTGHWARDCPTRKPPVPTTTRPNGPKVMVTLEDAPEGESTPEEESTTEEEPQDAYSVKQASLELAQLSLADEAESNYEEDEEGNIMLELMGTIQDHLARILADTGAGLSIVSESFVSKYHLNTKPTKTRTVHGVTGHKLTINSSATVQVVIGKHVLGAVEASVANTAEYDLILGFSELKRLRPMIQWDTGQLKFKTQAQKDQPEDGKIDPSSSGGWPYWVHAARHSALIPSGIQICAYWS